MPMLGRPTLILCFGAAGIEIIEVNGAVFYRKRKPVPPPPANVTPAAKRPCGGPEGMLPLPAGQDLQEFAAEAEPSMSSAEGEEAALLAVDQTPVPPTVDALTVLQGQLQSCLPDSCPKAISVQFALEQLLLQGAQRLDQAEAQQRGDSSVQAGGGLYSGAVKRLVQGFARLMQDKVQGASSLLLQVRPPGEQGFPSVPVPPPPSSVSGGVVTIEAGERAEAEASRGTDMDLPSTAASTTPAAESASNPPLSDPSLSEFLSLPPMIRDLSQSGAALKGLLMKQLSELREEEKAWDQIMAKGVVAAAGEVAVGGVANVGPMEGGGPTVSAPQEADAVPADKSVEESASAMAAPPVVPEAPASVLKKMEDSMNAAMGIQV